VALPEPVPGLVIRYAYLWAEEHRRGREEGVKDRPCAVVLIAADAEGEQWVTVLPVTHTPPTSSEFAVEIPAATKRRLGLDAERSWVVLSEANRFLWPGPDMRPARQADAKSVAYGQLPYTLFEEIRRKFIAAIRVRRAGLEDSPVLSEGLIRMEGTVEVTIPVEPEAAAALADARDREAVGRLVSRLLRPRSGPSPLAQAIAEMKAALGRLA
jgi:hypothetical protein